MRNSRKGALSSAGSMLKISFILISSLSRGDERQAGVKLL
jgi:hypothetical protein